MGERGLVVMARAPVVKPDVLDLWPAAAILLREMLQDVAQLSPRGIWLLRLLPAVTYRQDLMPCNGYPIGHAPPDRFILQKDVQRRYFDCMQPAARFPRGQFLEARKMAGGLS